MPSEIIKKQIGKRSTGRPSKVTSIQGMFVPSLMDPTGYALGLIRDVLPDPDEIMARGGLGYSDLVNLERDAHISSCIQQRKSATLAHRIRIEPGPGASGPIELERAVKICRRTLDLWGQNLSNTISQLLDARFLGMQPFELNYFYDNTVEAIICERPQDTLQEWFVYTPDGELRFRRAMDSFVTKPIPPFKILNVRNFPTMRNPYGKKLFSPCFWPATFKRGGLRFFAEYAEKFGMPNLLVKSNSNSANSKELKAFVAQLLAMARKGVIVTTGQYDVSLNDMETKYQTTHLYDSFMDAMDKESSKALLGQTLTTDEGGSRAQGDIHKQILEVLWKSDDEFVSAALTDLFQILTFINFGPDVISPVARVGEAMGLERLERDAKLRDVLGVDFTDEYLMRNYDLQPGDFVRVAPLKASYASDPSVEAVDPSPSGAPIAGTRVRVAPGFSPTGAGGKANAGSSAGASSRTSPKQGGTRKSEAAKNVNEKRDNYRKRGSN